MIIYAICVLLYFIDFLHTNQKVNRLAFWLLLVVWVLQTIFLCLYMIKTGRFPVLTIFEGLYCYVWLIIGLAVFINTFFRLDFILFFTNVLGFVLMVVHAFAPFQIHSQVMAQQLVSELLFIHITMAKLERLSYILNVIGIPILFISLVLGLRWAHIKLPDVSWMDSKIVGSLINMASFLLVLNNFFLFNSLSGFHYWNI